METTLHRDTAMNCNRHTRTSIRRLRSSTARTSILSVGNARRAAIALLDRCGEVAIAVAVLRAQEAGSSGRYKQMASWYRIANAAFEYAKHGERSKRRSATMVS